MTSAPDTDSPTPAMRRRTFAQLHIDGTFVLPNAWDIGSARILAALGFPAIATTSSGHAASLGRSDQNVTFDELVEHAATLVGAVDIPVTIDAERCFADTPDELQANVARLAATGAAGLSIEDYDPRSGIEAFDDAVERVATAALAARDNQVFLTARADNHLYGVDDLDDTIHRLTAYRDVGADCVYAPGLTDLDDIARVVAETDVPVNVLALPDGPTVSQLAEVGVRRVSTGGALAFAAYGALAAAARELLSDGTSSYSRGTLTTHDRQAAFVPRTPRH
jgi:2-methylisocitrate lyase-like PEP mutase family enzyme